MANHLTKRLIIMLMVFNLMLFGGTACYGAMTSGGGYQIWADVFSTGGGDASSTNFQLNDTTGEAAVGRSSSTNYTVRAGFRELDYFSGNETLSLSLGSATLALGTLSTSAITTGSHTLTIDSNSHYGVSVTFSGATLTSGLNTIAGIGPVAAVSAPGTNQFGFNVIFSSATGSTPASSVSPYSTAGQYAFDSGDQIISSTADINQTVFNLNYMANISSAAVAGTYATTITYTATANF